MSLVDFSQILLSDECYFFGHKTRQITKNFIFMHASISSYKNYYDVNECNYIAFNGVSTYEIKMYFLMQ